MPRVPSRIRRVLALVAALAAAIAGVHARADEGGVATSLSLEEVAPPGSEAAVSRYRIDAGDGVAITVYGEPDLSVEEVKVNGDGRISMPLIGELDVRGLTARELESLVTRRLADGYLRNPSVSVNIEKYRLFYIKGEVREPGGYDYVEGLTVEKAVALAGGYTERASEGSVKVVRESDPAKRAVSAGPETLVEPGDVVTIGESFF